VLLVDDNDAVRDAVHQAIEDRNIQVVAEAGTGREAVSVAQGVDPDLVLLDIDLPDMSGIDVVRALSAILPRAKIVMLTVSNSSSDLLRAVEAGAKGYLLKGLAPAALRRAVYAAAHGELAMPRDLAAQVVTHFAGHTLPRSNMGSRADQLSSRELEVLRLLSEGLTDREIADLLTVSSRTVEAHVGSILRKLGARNRAAATRVYLEG
jgi:DNA-binding NarL/FixJ family response regulator